MNKLDFIEKLDLLITKNSINKNILAKESGIPYTTIDGFYKKGYENAKLSTIRKLAKYFDTTLDYLMRDEITDINFGKTDGFKINYTEMLLVRRYRDLDSHGKEMVDTFIDMELKRIEQDKEKDPESEEPKPILLTARGGHIEMSEDEAAEMVRSSRNVPDQSGNKDLF